MKFQLLAAGLFAATGASAQDAPVVTVYTYDSFVTEWGPGPAIEAAFEAECACELRFVGAGDGAALLARLRLEGERTEADVVLGLDTNLTAAAADTGLFAPHGLDPELDLPVEWEDDIFLPFDWSYFAFVHRNELNPPESFRELAESDVSVLIQDPRSSTPGLGLLLWVEAAYGDEAGAFWSALADNIVTVTAGWSEAYNLFLEGEADMVLSYTTSPAYHAIAEEDDGFAAAAFEEGHYLQIEVGGIVASTDQPELARDFLAFMLSDAAQSVIPTTNWMYPAVVPQDGLPEGFGDLIQPDRALLYPPDEAAAAREAALDEWLLALSR
ncbi:thiamine ABC transporter substrate binding subunit [Roseitranquillus sediminis]|uniref:thiamine ABC transporter substrate binding subunit n=1 Tax=Roseitranquillus sediminis TaxID=2809051 RepID=UPI001D0CA285|nr:thiamine ABC transporter substrate binding subunit [Roseitranquillus sediminis]MBM9593520.1 thiamine ABC transporter substrate binding subunit [Roseitranquillus sediminis]